MARKNAQELRLPVHFHQADLCKQSSLGLTFDLIVSNPPYIPRSERSGIQARVRESEPELALFAPTEDPLKYYHCLLRLGLQRMPEGGTVYVETHYLWAGQVAAAFEASGYEEISLKKDIFGKERYVRGKVPADRSKK